MSGPKGMAKAVFCIYMHSVFILELVKGAGCLCFFNDSELMLSRAVKRSIADGRCWDLWGTRDKLWEPSRTDYSKQAHTASWHISLFVLVCFPSLEVPQFFFFLKRKKSLKCKTLQPDHFVLCWKELKTEQSHCQRSLSEFVAECENVYHKCVCVCVCVYVCVCVFLYVSVPPQIKATTQEVELWTFATEVDFTREPPEKIPTMQKKKL